MPSKTWEELMHESQRQQTETGSGVEKVTKVLGQFPQKVKDCNNKKTLISIFTKTSLILNLFTSLVGSF